MSALSVVSPAGHEILNIGDRPDAELLAKLPHSSALRLGAIPVRREGESVVVAMLDCENIFAIDELKATLAADVIAVPCEQSLLSEMLQRSYRRSDEIRKIARVLEQELSQHQVTMSSAAGDATSAEDAPVMKLLQNIFVDALELGSSDIHLEPGPASFRIRQRVDGLLQEQRVDKVNIFAALVIRLKLMAELDIAEKRIPQEGRFVMPLLEQEVEVRIATMPTAYGESVTMRLQVKSKQRRELGHLGFNAAQTSVIQKVLQDPQGMVLVVGPTGSGKSTTLNALLSELDTSERKLLTVEDPIEVEVERATQVQVNNKIGLGFADVLRVALRHDPDVILVGEMRDKETAEMAVRAAMTGHLLLSTLHCNDAQSALPRLLDMGVEKYLVAGALRLVVAQRLLRKVCQFCAEPREVSKADLAWLSSFSMPAPSKYKEGKGCHHCGGSGLRGRVGVYELLELSDELGSAMLENQLDTFEKQQLQKNSLWVSAFEKADQGQTTFAEIRRVLGNAEGLTK